MTRGIAAALAVGLWLGGCATDTSLREGERLIAEGRTEEGLNRLEQAAREHPGDAHYRAALLRHREAQLNRLLAQAERALQDERLDEAEQHFRQVLRLHPENARAPAGLAAVEAARRHRGLLHEAQAALKQGDEATARLKLRTVLAQMPRHAAALALLKEVEAHSGRKPGAESAQLAEVFRKPITLEFRNAPIGSAFDVISQKSGINFVFDKDVRLDQRGTVFARDTAIVDAIDMLLVTSQLSRKVLNGNTLLIYPSQATKHRDYQDLMVKSFFLANADAKSAMNMVKSMAKVKDAFVDEKLNMLVVRDTPEVVRVAEKLIRLQDRPEPEVMLEVEILELKRSKLTELGIQYPNQFSVLNVVPSATSVTTPTGTTITTPSQTPLTIQSLKDLGAAQIAISPTPAVNLRHDDSDVNLLANPRIRVKNKDKARIHIGDKVPVITANTTSTGVVSESVSYLDVGLKLDVEPLVHLEGDVAIKVSLEVSNIVREIKSGTGTLTYQLGSRNAATALRLKDGETQVLAGLISDEDRASANKVPGLGDLPLLGRLFSNHRNESNKTEIVLLITPRVIRAVERPELDQAEFSAGTESRGSDQPLQLRPASVGLIVPEVPAEQAGTEAEGGQKGQIR